MSDLNLDADEFNFDKSGITENEYYNILDTFLNLNWVSKISHSLPLNTITIVSKDLDTINSGHLLTNIPEDILIRYITIEENQLKIQINSTKWLCNSEDKSDYYGNSYSDEAMAYLYCELNLIDSIKPIKLIRENDKLEVESKFASQIYTDKIDDICSFMGYSISEFEIKNNTVDNIRFKFDGSREFSKSAVRKFQKSKYEDIITDKTYQTTPVKLPSGEYSTPEIWMIKNANNEIITKFPRSQIDAPEELHTLELTCYEIPVENIDDAMLTISDWPNNIESIDSDDNSTPMSIKKGYGCPKTNKLYIFDETIFNELVNFDNNIKMHKVEYENNEWSFELFNCE